jgi:hypothetical protein
LNVFTSYVTYKHILIISIICLAHVVFIPVQFPHKHYVLLHNHVKLSVMLSFLKILPVAQLTWNIIGVFQTAVKFQDFKDIFFHFSGNLMDTAKISGFQEIQDKWEARNNLKTVEITSEKTCRPTDS